LLLTGKGMGPSMFEIANFLGKEECLERMNQGLTTIKGN
jgi:glutamyl-tRNA synthetase